VGEPSPGAQSDTTPRPPRWVLRDDTGLAPAELATLPLVVVTAVQAVLGPRAGHARAVFGQVSLPMNAPVELVVTAAVHPASFTPSAG
jgi:hypothetical protein